MPETHSSDMKETITLEAMADDIAALIKHLGLVKVDVMGYSTGGHVALQTAILNTAFKNEVG
jgi:pimeloyl-ACP methyl ester carboxylesterase